MALFLKRCPARFAFLLEHPLRRRLLRVDRLVESLPIARGARVLDLGSGSGVVAERLVGRLGGRGLVLCDAQPAMLSRARRRLPGPTNTVAAVAEALPFAGETFEIVLLVTVLGELDDAAVALREVRRVLRPDGVLSISEHLPDPDFRSLPAVRALMRDVGFVEAATYGSRWSYTANFTKRAGAAEGRAG